MHISVAICTWNRCELLRQTLEHMASVLRVPRGVTWELLVVNNNSTDATEDVIDLYRERLPVRRLFQPLQGHSHARNLAVQQFRGEYLLWTDDDVLVDAEWLAGYCRAFRRWPGSAIFGGPVRPWFASEPPRWLQSALPSLSIAYALRDLGPLPVPLSAGVLPFGANMAVRAREQRRFRFDPRLGHRGGLLLAGEETGVMRAILAAGGTGWWIPDAPVQHCIPAERQTRRYLRSYYSARGRRLHREAGARGRWLDLPGWVLQALAGELAFRVGLPIAAPRIWIRALRAASIAQGYLGEVAVTGRLGSGRG